MSNHPLKKSDINKAWMKKRRDRSIIIRPEYHLIVSEGTKTEPQYFMAIREIINKNYPGRIHLDIHGEGDNTLSLFEKAVVLAEKSPNVYKHVWLVYDTDDFPAAHINSTVDKCKSYSNDETEYHAIWSNQCIELWFLLHFSFMHSDLHRNEYYPKLTENLTAISMGIYEKNRKDMFNILQPYIRYAIKNAKKLDDINNDKTPADSKPGTKVYELIEKLLPYLTEG